MPAAASTVAPGAPHPGAEAPFALSVDVEDYYQVQAFAHLVPRADWGKYPSRVGRNTERVLQILAGAGATGTFFVLGRVAREHPEVVRAIAAGGHEVASHGMSHLMLTELSPGAFREEVRESKALLEDLAQLPVLGYRAPSYSLNATTLWALEILAETGYLYDSSVYPIRRRRYGYPGGPVRPARVATGKGVIAEFPMPTVPIGPLRFPVLAGAYLRLLPRWMSLAATRYHASRGLPLVVNVHPWELDPDQPVIGPSRRATWTHYARLHSTAGTLRAVLSKGPFRDMATRLRELGLIDAAAPRAGEMR